MGKVHSRQVVIIGKERSGKTYWAENFANSYAMNKGCSFVYNVGMPSDYSEFARIDLMDAEEHEEYIYNLNGKDAAKKYQRRPKIYLFKFNGKVYHYKDFCAMFYKRRVKAKSLFGREDSLFWRSVHDYFSRCLIVCDDSKVLFQDGIKKGHRMVMNRKNHTGEESPHYKKLGSIGLDLLLMFHSADEINKDIWTFTTDLIILDTTVKPRLTELKNVEQKEKIWEMWEYLKKQPEFTAIQIPMKGKDFLKPKLVSI